jgi:phosphoenolpyruvate---glycerone phosphotransferase subunit DhaL
MPVTYEDVVKWIEGFASEMAANKQSLTRLDSAIGDGDHGTNMERGMRAALQRVETFEGRDIGALLKGVGMALVSKVGGAAGPLYGTFFMQLGAGAAGKEELSAEEWSAAWDAGVKGVQTRGKAEPEDKTMVDALAPARDALAQAVEDGASLRDAVARAASAAEEGMKATVPLVARKGRASYLGERSAGHQDPGATSSYLLVKTAAAVVGGEG